MSPQDPALPSRSFGDFDGRVWLNTAHQGPLPLAAVDAAAGAARTKASPHRMADADFTDIPERLRALLARLVGGRPGEVVLGDSTSHGLHLVANGLAWNSGDEVLVVAGDYPATVLPWQRLGPDGVDVRALHPAGPSLTADELEDAIGPRTRVLALTWVDSFTGAAADLAALGGVCRARGVLLVVNASQGLGARTLDVASSPVDAVACCGYKWLCGPYGTGFTWLHPDLLARLRPTQAYWLAMRSGRGLDTMRDTELRTDLGVRAFDRFCIADPLDTLPWTASLELLLATGPAAVESHDQALVQRLLDGVAGSGWEPVSPLDRPSRSTLVVLSRPDGTARARHALLTGLGVDTALREGNVRLSPHLFTSPDDIDRALEGLHAAPR